MRKPLMTDKASLIEALRLQRIVCGKLEIAKKICRYGKLGLFEPHQFLIRQDEDKNEVFFIIDGQVSILVNGREIGVLRTKREHVGEMAGLESSRRANCVKALKPTKVVSLEWKCFAAIANQHPEIWQAIALQLAERLRERSRFIRRPNECPAVFVGSSSESLPIATALAETIHEKSCVHCRPWSDPSIFAPSSTTIESLVQAAEKTDLAVLVFGPDDTVRSRGSQAKAPRDNVIFELGLFIGALGRQRTLLVCPRGNDLKIPSDLLGVTPLKFGTVRGRPNLNEVRALGSTIKAIALKHGAR